MLNWSSSGLQWRSCKEFGHVWINFRNGSVLQLGEKQLFPCHWARQCPVMTHSLNQTGEEKLQAIFIPVISVLSEFKAGSCCGHIKQDQNCPTGNLFFCFCSTCRDRSSFRYGSNRRCPWGVDKNQNVSNLWLYLTGMFQRLDKLRKNAFASVILFGTNNDSSISGIWVFRGQELAFTVSIRF